MDSTEINLPYEVFRDGIEKDCSFQCLYSMLLYADSDKAEIIVDGEKVTIETGRLCYIFPHTEITVIKGSGLIGVKLDLHTLDLPSWSLPAVYAKLGERRKKEQKYCIISGRPSIEIAEILERLAEFGTNYAFGTQTIIYRLISFITDIIKIPERKYTEPFYTVTEYIDKHASEPLEANDLAGKCGMSYPNFAKRFREHYGRSCKEYITHIRIVKARLLLLNTNKEISEIAAETGFFDSSHFIRNYKKIIGVTPNQCRSMV